VGGDESYVGDDLKGEIRVIWRVWGFLDGLVYARSVVDVDVIAARVNYNDIAQRLCL
jgi:hypothetical protein